jgi:hypothetical protein
MNSPDRCKPLESSHRLATYLQSFTSLAPGTRTSVGTDRGKIRRLNCDWTRRGTATVLAASAGGGRSGSAPARPLHQHLGLRRGAATAWRIAAARTRAVRFHNAERLSRDRRIPQV